MFRRRNETEHATRLLMQAGGFVLRAEHPSHSVWDHWSDGRILLTYEDGGWRVPGTNLNGSTRWSLLRHLTGE